MQAQRFENPDPRAMGGSGAHGLQRQSAHDFTVDGVKRLDRILRIK
jgi:hypothetical protein